MMKLLERFFNCEYPEISDLMIRWMVIKDDYYPEELLVNYQKRVEFAVKVRQWINTVGLENALI